MSMVTSVTFNFKLDVGEGLLLILPTEKPTMVQICCVCYNTRNNNNNVSFHSFPKDISKRTMWLNALNLTSISNWKKVCSAHFSANDFIFSNNRNILRSTAVPTRFKLLEEHSYADNVSIYSPCLMISDVYDRSPSTSKTKSYENVNAETSRPSLFNLWTDLEVITLPKKTRRIWSSNQIGNLSDEVSSAHFSVNDFIFSDNRNILQSTAVPTSNYKLLEEHSYARGYANDASISSPCLMIPDVSPSNSRTKSYEKVNVVETSRPSLFNLCTDVDLEVITPPKKTRRIWSSSRIGDLRDEDFSSPERRKNNLCLIRNTVKNIRRKNKILSQRNQRLKKKVSSLLDIINELKNKLLISEHAALNLEITEVKTETQKRRFERSHKIDI
ncbi:uncharacterized protein LOC132942189 isoform X2 [Metopolophium dirhodum]|uniref:uncharacterized protein LOC132942189 isoform X2 n=1 Tax=Metopolophium dirhodum TaxID=44670 RepID=UPI00298FE385|nr:uncharacterized protein LOC132942189 isoform X2 [Metopolophium dirhodum]